MRYLPWLTMLAAASLGVVDLVGLLALGIHMNLAGYDVTVPVMLFYTATFGALGFAIGKLVQLRRRLEVQYAELQRSQARLVEAEKLASVGRMAASVAHEVRNPLGVIRSAASLVAESVPDDPVLREATTFIVAEVDRLDGFVRRILDFSRPIRVARQAVPLGPLLDRARTLAAPQLDGVVVQVPSAAAELQADPDLVVQLLMTLLVNAGEAEAGRIEVRVDRDDTEVRVELADDGPGVGPDDVERVFEPFVTTKAQGSGLGLAMARRIAEAHHGHLALVSGRGAGPDGAGACFRLALPVAEVPS